MGRGEEEGPGVSAVGVGSGFRGLAVDIYMDLGVSEVRLCCFCVCGGVVGSTRCSFKWGFSCRNLGLPAVCG